LLRRVEAELIEDTCVAIGQPLRHLEVNGAGRQHPRGHELDHLLQATLPHGSQLFREQPVQQRQRCQQRVGGGLARYFDHEPPAGTSALTLVPPVGLHRQDVALQREGCGLAHVRPPVDLSD